MKDINKLEAAVGSLSDVLSNGKVSQEHILALHAGMESLDLPIPNPSIRQYSRVLSDIGLESANWELENAKYALTQLNYENSKHSLKAINDSIEQILDRINNLKEYHEVNQEVVDALLDEASWKYNKYNVDVDGDIGKSTETVEDSILNPYVLRTIVAKFFGNEKMVSIVELQKETSKYSPFLNWVASKDLDKIIFDLEFNVNDVYIKDVVDLIISDKITNSLNNISRELTEYYLNSYRSAEFSPKEIKNLVDATKLDDTEQEEKIDKEYWGLVNTKYHGVFVDHKGIDLFLSFYSLIYSKEKTK